MPFQGAEGGTALLVIASREDQGQLVSVRTRVEELINQSTTCCEA
jgi:hypothetical protein